jgi:hypothetical protein
MVYLSPFFQVSAHRVDTVIDPTEKVCGVGRLTLHSTRLSNRHTVWAGETH